jgi:hypothetical protein
MISLNDRIKNSEFSKKLVAFNTKFEQVEQVLFAHKKVSAKRNARTYYAIGWVFLLIMVGAALTAEPQEPSREINGVDVEVYEAWGNAYSETLK